MVDNPLLMKGVFQIIDQIKKYKFLIKIIINLIKNLCLSQMTNLSQKSMIKIKMKIQILIKACEFTVKAFMAVKILINLLKNMTN